MKILCQITTISCFGLLLLGVAASFFGPINTDILVGVLIVCAVSGVINLFYLKKTKEGGYKK